MKFRLIFILCILFAKIVFSQSFDRQQRISIPSPNALSFAVFDSFPAVPNTGVPDISIPIYDFKYREVSIPIILRYNTNLVKPDIQPTWVGLGWNLDIGGQIIRVVNDKPDDLQYVDNFTLNNTGETNVGLWYNYAFFRNDGWDSEIKVKAAADDWRNYPGFISNFGSGFSVKDYEPDDFVFSFLGITGKFYLDENRKWKVKCNQKIKVEVNDSDVSAKGFLKITLTDTKGTRYVFGENENAIEYANSLFFTYRQRLQAKTWNLSKIILSNNEEISFNYKKVHPSVTATPSFFSNVGVTPGFPNGGMLQAGSVTVPSYLESIVAPNGEIKLTSSSSEQLGFDREKFAYMEKRIAKTYIDALNSVMIPGGYVANWDFELNVFPVPNTSSTDMQVPISTSSLIGLKLDDISVKNKLDDIVKVYKFSYTNDVNERLKLLKFEELNNTLDTKINTYHFLYNSLKLPEYLSYKTDHWGFYNGKLLDLSNTTAFYNSRQPDPEYAKAEVLDKIEYPTGGYVTYEFEGHSYSKELDLIRSNPLLTYNESKVTGGLRIKKITNYSSLDQISNLKEFKYVNGYSLQALNQLSSGVLGGQTFYDLYLLQNSAISAGNIQSLYPLTNNANGSHIAYSEVVEKYVEGYQVKYYTNFDSGVNGEYMDGLPEFSIGVSNQTYNEKDFERGLLLMQNTYNQTGELVSKNEIKYSRIIDQNDFVKNIKSRVIGTFVPSNPSQSTFTGYVGSYYKKFTYAYLPTEEISTVYDFLGSNPISSLKKYEYDLTTKNLRSESFLNSKDTFVKKTNVFSYDMVALNRDPENIYAAMVLKNIISPVIEQTETNNSYQTLLLRTNYGKFNINDLLLPKSIEEQVGNGPMQTKHIFSKYDMLGNLLEEKGADGIPICYLWSYKNQFPILTIKNAAYTSLESYFVFDPNYIGYFGELNPSYSSIQYLNGTLRLALSLKDSQIFSYTYKPLVGMTSQTDARGVTTFYEYDSFQRLKTIRDQNNKILKSYTYHYKQP